jgi:sialate O-acetylesterase
MKMRAGKIFLFIFFAGSLFNANADVRLPSVIANNMVLQQNSSVKLWGWAEPGEKILVTPSWNNKTDSVKADENGKWQLNVNTIKAGGPYTITIKGHNTITLQNVLLGEVWVCSGQSNMEMNYYWGLPQMKEDFPTAYNPNIRFFYVPRKTALTPQENGEGSWTQCDSNTVKSFSAVAYYFGRKLNGDLNVPIGLLHASWGGTPAEAWTPSEKVNDDPVLKEASMKLKRSEGWPITPGYTFNAMISPLTNYTIAGAIWYQGEGNTANAATYDRILTTMIKTWRDKWNKELPFYYVQIAPFTYGPNKMGAQVREAQAKVLALSNTGMVVTTDLADDTTNIHPKNKRDVGIRLANLALADTYRREIAGAKSPLFKEMKTDKDKLVLLFDHAKSGMIIEGKTPVGFLIAGEDRKFYPATVKLNGDKIVLSSKSVPNPVAVRYAFTNTAVGNIFNKEGLPLSPFRTDDWELDASPNQ